MVAISAAARHRDWDSHLGPVVDYELRLIRSTRYIEKRDIESKREKEEVRRDNLLAFHAIATEEI